jgi:hypothetical protein
MKAILFLILATVAGAEDKITTRPGAPVPIYKGESKAAFNWDAWNAQYVKIIQDGREIWIERDKSLAKK